MHRMLCRGEADFAAAAEKGYIATRHIEGSPSRRCAAGAERCEQRCRNWTRTRTHVLSMCRPPFCARLKDLESRIERDRLLAEAAEESEAMHTERYVVTVAVSSLNIYIALRATFGGTICSTRITLQCYAFPIQQKLFSAKLYKNLYAK